jgi:hypothetical protein
MFRTPFRLPFWLACSLFFWRQSLHLALSSIFPLANPKATFKRLIYPSSTSKLGKARHIPLRCPNSRTPLLLPLFQSRTRPNLQKAPHSLAIFFRHIPFCLYTSFRLSWFAISQRARKPLKLEKAQNREMSRAPSTTFQLSPLSPSFLPSFPVSFETKRYIKINNSLA